MVLIAVFLLFLLLIAIPFFIAIKELLHPKDNQPLYIDMLHSKDPLYFGRAFKNKIEQAMQPFDNKDKKGPQMGKQKLRISKSEPVEISDSKCLPDEGKVSHLIYVHKSFITGNRTILMKDVFVKGRTVIGSHSAVRAIYGEQDISLGKLCEVKRWICGEHNIYVGPGCNLGRNIACTGRLELDPGCRFQSMFAGPVLTTGIDYPRSLQDTDTAEIMALDFPTPDIPPVKPTWKIIKKHVSINCDDQCLNNYSEDESKDRHVCCQSERGFEPCNPSHWQVSRNRVTVEPLTTIPSNFVSRKDLVIKEFCRIKGSVKGFKNITVENNVEIHGDIFCEGDIRIGDQCTLLGNVFSQSGIYIGDEVRISQPGTIKSVIAKKKIEIGRNSLIFGYILSEGYGLVK